MICGCGGANMDNMKGYGNIYDCFFLILYFDHLHRLMTSNPWRKFLEMQSPSPSLEAVSLAASWPVPSAGNVRPQNGF